MARMHDESLKYVLSDNAIVALAEKVPLTETDISTTISQADISATRSPSSVVLSHLVDFRSLLQNESQNPDEILQLYIKKHLGPNGSCPLSRYNYNLLSKSNIEVPKRLVSEFSKQVGKKDSRERFVQKYSCKSPVFHNCRIYANNGRFLCYSYRSRIEWYLQKDLAKLIDEEDPPAIKLLFEPKPRGDDKGIDFYLHSTENICVGCGEGNHYLRYRIIPECYRMYFPKHLKGHYSNNILLVCVDCHKKAYSAAENYKKKVALEYGIPLFVHGVVISTSPSELRTAAVALLRHGARMPPQRRKELRQVVKKYYGGREISDEDLETASLDGLSPHEKRQMQKKRGLLSLNNDIEDGADESKNATNELENGSMLDCYISSEPTSASAKQNGSIDVTSDSKLSLLGHGPHGKQVVDYLLKEHGEDGIHEFCQRWRQVFVEAINPRFLPAGWDHVTDR